VELIKGSLATFLNAFTFPDKTMYPVASQNTQDFYNLIDVYLDAVFYPRITPDILKQEGWHYELDKRDDPLRYKGVVFNEMKGAYSSPDSLLYKYTQQTLFPDNTYGVDSGGDPTEIPNLSYEQFKSFYQKYYHPSNSRIYFYGDDNPEERLRKLSIWLDDFESLAVEENIELQTPWQKPQCVIKVFGAGEDTDAKGMTSVSWMLTEPFDIERNFALAILEHILIGTAASPLRKALTESGLGEDVIRYGLLDGLRQMAFSTGLKGVQLENMEEVETLILDTLSNLAQEGIDPDTVAASLNTIEFQLREQNTGGFPRGLVTLINSMSTWLYGGDPIAPLAFEAPLENIKAKVASGEKIFEQIITDFLLNNPHRSTLLLQPDSELNKRLEVEEKAKLEAIRKQLSKDDLQWLVEDTERLRRLQEMPDSPGAIATIPMLKLNDLDTKIKPIPTESLTLNGVNALFHNLFTNGIVYLDIGFNLEALPQTDLPFVDLFCTALLEMGTHTQDYVKLSQRIGSKTGGIRPSIFSSQRREDRRYIAWGFMRGKSTVYNIEDLLLIYRDIFLTTNFDDRDRFKQIVLKAKAQSESSLVPRGHNIVNTRLHSHFNVAGWVEEQISGLENLFFLRNLLEQIGKDWARVLERLASIRNRLMRRNTLMINVTLDHDNWSSVHPKLSEFVSEISDAPVDFQTWDPDYVSFDEGLTIPAQVNYVGFGANLYEQGYEFDGSILPILNYLRTTWIWERVRVQGGAYGGYIRFDPNSGTLNFLSYRDPNIATTLENYRNTVDFIRNLNLSELEITRSVIGAIGDIDAYKLSDAKGFSALQRHLIGYTDDMRQQTRDQILSTTMDDFRVFADALQQVNEVGQIVVLGSLEAIIAANETGDTILTIKKVQ
jgi:Zn-dependent M16 (insulinase) family peptidase